MTQIIFFTNNKSHPIIDTLYSLFQKKAMIFSLEPWSKHFNSTDPDLIVLDLQDFHKYAGAIRSIFQYFQKMDSLPILFLVNHDAKIPFELNVEEAIIDFLVYPSSSDIISFKCKSLIHMSHSIRTAQRNHKQMQKFVGIVSHDLRSPITNVKLIAELLEEAPENLSTFTKSLLKSANWAYQLINDILDLTAMETGRIKLDKMDQDFNEIAEEVIIETKLQAARKDIHLQYEEPKASVVYVDRKRIIQVLINLIWNAIKFTPRSGTITLSAVAENSGLLVSVCDTGVGITIDSVPRLFNKHEKFFTHGTEGESGTGYGLPLSQELINAHGSRIEVKMNHPQGSCFFFHLPWGYSA